MRVDGERAVTAILCVLCSIHSTLSRHLGRRIGMIEGVAQGSSVILCPSSCR